MILTASFVNIILVDTLIMSLFSGTVKHIMMTTGMSMTAMEMHMKVFWMTKVHEMTINPLRSSRSSARAQTKKKKKKEKPRKIIHAKRKNILQKTDFLLHGPTRDQRASRTHPYPTFKSYLSSNPLYSIRK